MGHRDTPWTPAPTAASMAPAPILCVVGARPNYMKMAPLLRALAQRAGSPPVVLVHTGQHYDPALNERLFEALGLRAPDVNLEVGSASHAVQTAEVMRRFEPVLEAHRPALVVVVGDVNSTLACALVAAKRGVPVAHVEAGLRSGDRTMPEEINRVLTDQLSDWLYTTEPDALGNLLREGIDPARIVFTGNLMIDSLHHALPSAVAPRRVLEDAGLDAMPFLDAEGYALVTLHRPSNVDDAGVLDHVVDLLRATADRLPVVWPLHPRTRAQLERFGLLHRVVSPRMAVLPPQGYLEMVGLMHGARVVLTDSGGVQEETTALGVPCLTLRENTERPVTVNEGTNTLVGRDAAALKLGLDRALARSAGDAARRPEGWDGRSAERIAAHLCGWLAGRRLDTPSMT